MELIALHLLMVFDSLMQEVGSGNTSQKSDEEDFVKVDDLPLQLTVMCEVTNNLDAQIKGKSRCKIPVKKII